MWPRSVATLSESIAFLNRQLKLGLSDDQLADLVEYLKSL
jgi:hypothetical protein